MLIIYEYKKYQYKKEKYKLNILTFEFLYNYYSLQKLF